MWIFDKVSENFAEIVISEVSIEDFRTIRKSKMFVFDWSLEQEREVFKLCLKRDVDQVLGLLSIDSIPEEFRIHINLQEVAKHQIGKTKTLDNIAGCLIAYACTLSFKRGFGGFVSLKPKTRLIEHYQKKYGFVPYGQLMAVEFESSKHLIDKYLRR